jgi:hypothetical protein
MESVSAIHVNQNESVSSCVEPGKRPQGVTPHPAVNGWSSNPSGKPSEDG